MNTQQLLHLIDQLETGIDPSTRKPFDQTTSCLQLPDIAAALGRFRGVLMANSASVADAVPDPVLRETCSELTQLGYRPVPDQVIRVLRASRSIADPTLKAVSAYGAFRSKVSKRYLEQAVTSFAARCPECFGEAKAAVVKPKKEVPAYKQNPFFRENNFDKLSDEKFSELSREVSRLGLAKPSDKIPEFMQRARRKYPRAYEPWSSSEQALLIEAMCYTNDAKRIALIFGRTADSVINTGLKLIYQSTHPRRVA